MSYFIGSDSFKGFTIGAIDNPNAIVKDEVYPICRFPGAHLLRRLTFSEPVVFEQNENNTIDFVNESGKVVFSLDISVHESADSKIEKIITVDIPATDLSIQTLGVRWVDKGGAFSATFSGNIFIYDASQMVSLG